MKQNNSLLTRLIVSSPIGFPRWLALAWSSDRQLYNSRWNRYRFRPIKCHL